MTATTNTDRGDLDSAREVLVFARESQAAANRAQADLMVAAVTWAEQHPPESIDQAATWITPGGDTGLTLAGEGAPLVAEFCIAEFALAIGRSTDGGRALVAAAVELKYRLPRCWARVQSGDLEAWRARRIAEATMLLSQEAAAFVDAQVAPFAHRIGIAALERLIAEAIARFMPEKAAEDARRAADGRHFTIDHQQVSFGGTSQITGELDLADALDLDTAVAKARTSCSRWDRPTPSTYAAPSPPASSPATSSPSTSKPAATRRLRHHRRRRPKPRQVVLHVHLCRQAAITGTSGCGGAGAGGEPATGSSPPTRSAPGAPAPTTEVVVKPVIDLNEHIHVEGYEVPDRLREQATLRDHNCVFPWCTRSARNGCRPRHPLRRGRHHLERQHRAPVSTAPSAQNPHSWTYTMLEPGSFLWSSPHGYQFLRDHHGTLDVSRDQPRALGHLTAPGLVWSLAALAARPPVVAILPRRTDVVSRRSLRSLLNHREPLLAARPPEGRAQCDLSAAGGGPLVD